MNRAHASAAVLGTSAALAAVFLAQTAPTSASTPNTRRYTTTAAVRRASVAAAMQSLISSDAPPRPPAAAHHATTHYATTAETPTVAIAVCQSCAPSRALVRVLLRQQRYGLPLPPLRIFADRTWPALDTLARHSRSTVVIIRQLAARVGVTPAAVSSTHQRPAIGVHDVLALATDQSALSRGSHP